MSFVGNLASPSGSLLLLPGTDGLVQIVERVVEPGLANGRDGKLLELLTQFLNGVSSSSPLGAEASLSLVSKSSAFLVAAAASAWVTPTMRQTPLVIPSSLSRKNPLASLVLLRWVPRQNSVLYFFQEVPCWGFCNIVGISSLDTETTRAGSG